MTKRMTASVFQAGRQARKDAVEMGGSANLAGLGGNSRRALEAGHFNLNSRRRMG